MSPASGEGSWTDSNGYAGSFKFFGAAGGPPRPDGNVYFRAGSHLTSASQSRIVWSMVSNNEGGGSYDAATGVYTVPATGLYSIAYSVGFNSGGSTFGYACASIVTATIPVPGEHASCAPVVANSGHITLNGATVLSLAAGQTIEVRDLSFSIATLSPFGSGLTIHKVR